MKTKLFIIASIVFCGVFEVNAQATQSVNSITAGSYLGTSNNLDIVFKRNAISAGLITADKVAFGLNSVATTSGISLGIGAGQYATGTSQNIFIGDSAGKGTSAGIPNTGLQNIFIGGLSGYVNTSGSSNVFIGNGTGVTNTSGSGNLALGENAGTYLTTGGFNTIIGRSAGFDLSTGSGNVFLGNNAGAHETGSDKLYIDNDEDTNPLIWGDFSAEQIKLNGKVAIGGSASTAFGNIPTTSGGTSVSAYKLFVKGGILTEEVRVSASGTWADYVFNKDYDLKPLSEVENFIKDNGHLPNVPSAAQVKDEGIALGEMAKIQQEKIEELTLYIIAQNKRIEALEAKINSK